MTCGGPAKAAPETFLPKDTHVSSLVAVSVQKDIHYRGKNYRNYYFFEHRTARVETFIFESPFPLSHTSWVEWYDYVIGIKTLKKSSQPNGILVGITFSAQLSILLSALKAKLIPGSFSLISYHYNEAMCLGSCWLMCLPLLPGKRLLQVRKEEQGKWKFTIILFCCQGLWLVLVTKLLGIIHLLKVAYQILYDLLPGVQITANSRERTSVIESYFLTYHTFLSSHFSRLIFISTEAVGKNLQLK